MRFYVVNGLPGTGKTLFGQYVAEELQRRGVNFVHLSSITPIKMLLMDLNADFDPEIVPSHLHKRLTEIRLGISEQNWDGNEKTPEWRRRMSMLKSGIMAEDLLLLNRWVIVNARRHQADIAFVDIREPHAIDLLKEHCEAIKRITGEEITVETILLRSDVEGAPFDNASDASVFRYEYDIEIQNCRQGLKAEESIAKLRDVAALFVDEHCLNPLNKHETIEPKVRLLGESENPRNLGIETA